MDEQPFIVCCIVIPVTLFIYDPNQQYDLSNVSNYSFSGGILVVCKVFFCLHRYRKLYLSGKQVFGSKLNQNYRYKTFQSAIQTLQVSLCLSKSVVLKCDQTKTKTWFISSIKTFLDDSHLQTIYMIGDILCSFCMLHILK